MSLDRPTFQAANPGLPFEDFSNTDVPPGAITGCGAPFNSIVGPPPCFDPGDIQPGLSMNIGDPTANQGVVLGGGGGGPFGNIEDIVGPNSFADDCIWEFDPPVRAAGFDVFTPIQASSFTVEVFDGNGMSLGTTNLTTPMCCPATQFWGVDTDSSDGIGSIRFTGATGQDAELFSNVEWGGSPNSGSTYCTAKSGLVCGLPAIDGSGVATVGATSGFTISAGPARGNRSGILLYSCSGRASLPFQGGLLCVNPAPLRRVPPVSSGGTNGACDGVFAVDWNTFASGNGGGNPDACIQTQGQQVNTQWWGRDSVATGSYLSDGLEFDME